MPKVRITTQPSGLLNGRPWPAAGETLDVPDVVARDLVAAGAATLVGRKASDDAERRPLTPAVEVRGDSPAKPDVPPANAAEGDVDVKVSDLEDGNGTVRAGDAPDGGAYVAPTTGDQPDVPDVPPTADGINDAAVEVAPLDAGNGTILAGDADRVKAEADAAKEGVTELDPADIGGAAEGDDGKGAEKAAADAAGNDDPSANERGNDARRKGGRRS